MSYYHVSPYSIEAGEILVPGIGNRVVFLTDSPRPHYTKHSAYYANWWIYEVQPLGEVWYGQEYYELMAEKAVVLKCLGDTSEVFPGEDPNPLKDKDKFSKVDPDNHPGIRQVPTCSYFKCEDFLSFLLANGFDCWDTCVLTDGEEGYLFHQWFDDALHWLNGDVHLLSEDAVWYYNKWYKPV